MYALAGEGDRDFPERSRQLLIATGCRQSEEAVASTFGYDLTKPDFWNRSLDLIEQRVAEFLALCDAGR